MRQELVFLLIFLALQTQAADVPCDIAPDVYKIILKRAEESPTSILWDRRRMDDMTRDCGVSLKKFGKPASYLDELEKKAYRIQFDDTRKKILTTNPDDDVDSLVSWMERSAKKGGMFKADFEEIDKLKMIAKNRKFEHQELKLKNFEDSCSKRPTNLSNLLPPHRDQDSIGWCYAFVAADLVSAKLGKDISGFDVALGYESKAFKDAIVTPGSIGEGGDVSRAIRAGWNVGYCEEKNIAPPPSGLFYHVGPLMKTLEGVYKKMEGMAVSVCDLQSSFSHISKNLKIQDFENILKASTYSEALELLRKRACPNRTSINQEFKIEEVFYPNTNYEAKYVIQDHLLKNRPVGINVDLRSILKEANLEEAAAHAMLVIGQERNEQNECVFIVRNSWGKSCSAFDREKVTCERDGTLRIRPEVLKTILTGTTVIL